MIVISDNSPLQYLVLIGCVDVLAALYGKVLTTPQVLDELRHPETPDAVRIWALSPPGWLKTEAPSHVGFSTSSTSEKRRQYPLLWSAGQI